MNKIVSSLIIVLSIFSFVSLNAQENSTIIDSLESNTDVVDGVINVTLDPAVEALIGKPNGSVDRVGSYEVEERQGFRLQIYMGSDQHKARAEASAREQAIKEAFPEMTTYLGYWSPNWKLLAGDFITREEATVERQRLLKEFPQFGKEIYIVVDKIKIPIDKGE
ncbi:hypothetical protein M2138_001909 [Dysgonomonadaceae bacterium PH5-43]|nr:hypothetical protein [Dysgonomonadaceae bacterium PH5-43]